MNRISIVSWTARGQVMNKKVGIAMKAGAVAVALVLASGCATNSRLDEVKATADRALSEAQAAKSTADSASRAANDAKQMAAAAQSAADQAGRAAQAAQACCNRNSEKIDRMFEKAQRK
ncbi:MAG: Lpp/OprI family alanine-zipper lipoprotein [Gammaproteobacteria bacterium]